VRWLLALGLVLATTAVPAHAAAPRLDCGTVAVPSVTTSKSVQLRVLRLGTGGLSCHTARSVARYAFAHASRTRHDILGAPPGWTCRGSAKHPDSGGLCSRGGKPDGQGVLMISPAQQAG
jgi:hypothetical protein